jgi:hypothetical protein
VEESKRRDVENAELRARIEELEKNKTVTTKLESENAEFRDRITKVEQRQMQNDNVTKETNSSNNSSSNFNSLADEFPMEMDTSLPEEPIPEGLPEPAVNIPVMDQCDQTSLEDKETDACSAFMLEQHKKSIGEEIRQKRREEKLQRESEASKKSENAELKGSQGDQARVAKLEQDSSVVGAGFHPEQPQDAEDDVAPKISDLGESDTTPEVKTVTKSHDQKIEPEVELAETENQIVEDLVQELICDVSSKFDSSSSNGDKTDVNEISKSCMQDMVLVSAQKLTELFDKAIKTGQKQILRWFYYSLEFENRVKSLTMDGKIKDKTARSKIYKEMKHFLPTITDVNLRKKTERARKILKLFGEGGVGIDRIQSVTYSASAISGLKDTQIQHIISRVKTVTKSHDHTWSKGTSDTSGEKLPDDLDGDDHRDRAEVSVSTIPIHQPNNPIYDQAYFRNKVLKLYPDVHLHRNGNAGTNDIYRCRTKSSLCPSCGTNL